MICPSASVQDDQTRFIEPSTAKAWLFDHLRLSASDPLDIQVDTECETIRSELEKAAMSYGKEHFTEGVSKVFTSEQCKLKPQPKPKVTATQAVPDPDTSETPKDLDTAMHEESVTVEPTETKTDTELVDPETEAPAGDDSTTADIEEGTATGQPATGQKTDEIDTDMVGKEADAPSVETEKDTSMETDTPVRDAAQTDGAAVKAPEASEQAADNQEEMEEELPAEPLPKRFSLYFVGNKYNPSNYW